MLGPPPAPCREREILVAAANGADRDQERHDAERFHETGSDAHAAGSSLPLRSMPSTAGRRRSRHYEQKEANHHHREVEEHAGCKGKEGRCNDFLAGAWHGERSATSDACCR
jgi:hypothetical protein